MQQTFVLAGKEIDSLAHAVIEIADQTGKSPEEVLTEIGARLPLVAGAPPSPALDPEFMERVEKLFLPLGKSDPRARSASGVRLPLVLPVAVEQMLAGSWSNSSESFSFGHYTRTEVALGHRWKLTTLKNYAHRFRECLSEWSTEELESLRGRAEAMSASSCDPRFARIGRLVADGAIFNGTRDFGPHSDSSRS